MSRHHVIENQALDWLIRKDEPEWSEAAQAELDAWLDESMAHKAAYWRAEHGWRETGRIKSLGVYQDDLPPPHSSWNRWSPALIAASVIVAVGIGAVTLQPGTPAPPQVAEARFDTPVGGHKTVALTDGSKIELNTATVLRTAVSDRSREVWLDSGEAYFEIAKRDGQPFIVRAGAQTVTVLGTKFSVRRYEDRVTVNVLEGRVRVDGAKSTTGSAAIISAGDFAVVRGPSTLIANRSEERVQSALAWRDGMLSFDQAPLSEVAAEFNRYNRKPIIVTDQAAAQIRIGGTFQAANVEAFIRLLRDAYDLKIEESAQGVKISS